ncbi:MAG: T9SS type A sorting domain-containing protein [Bacteroidota bacterium]|nr:T9SS type A sorting domain-containing protein [Bacteroidota bacterium]
MKKPAMLFLTAATFSITCFFLLITLSQCRNSSSASNEQLQEEQKGEEGEEHEEQSGAAKQLSGWFQAKGFPDASNLTEKYQRGWQQHLALKEKTWGNTAPRTIAANWAQLGYCTDGSGNRIGGRVVCMAIDPNNTNNLWIGTASGGMYKSVNSGTNWTPVQTNLNVLGVSSILVDPSNSNIIYAGTGEVYHTEVGVMGFNVWKTRGTYGIGIIKSTDGGTTWTQVMTKVSSDLYAIQSMAFRPGLSTTIFACATDGVYRSTNSGTTWSQIYTGVNVRDIAINPTTSDQIVISVGNMTNPVKGIYRTTNGNAATPTWTQITAGLPASFEGSIKMDNVGAGNLVASIGVSSALTNEVYRSTDFGVNWSIIAISGHCSYQFWFAHTIAINPFATDSLIYGGVSIYRHKIVPTIGRTLIGGLHADHHDIKFDPVRRGTVYVCNDGGVYKSTNGGVSFIPINNGLNATQFYASLGVSKQDANLMVGGLQDNGQVVYNGTNWVTPTGAGGDGTACAIHPTNDNILLACRDARAIKRSTNGGSSFSELTSSYWGFVGDSRTAFVAPIAFAPSNGSIAYQASDNIHISGNSGGSFSNNALGGGAPPLTPGAFIEQRHKTAIALAISTTNSSKLYVSTSPFAQYDNDLNNIYVTGNPNILRTTTPATTPYTSIKGTLPNRFITDIAISTNSDDSIYITMGGFGGAHVYLSPDGGTTWLSRSAGLPDVPFNAILIDPINESTIYAGSDFGVYVSTDRGITWQDYNTGFYDVTLIMDLQLDANNKLIAATHGKGVFRSDLYVPANLPVSLLDFTGTGAGTYNLLQWNVAQEDNFSRYELERSTDGASFTKVATIMSQRQTGPTAYRHNDYTTLFEAYYRLKIIDLDGTFDYSSIIFIRKADSKNEFSVMGNPFSNEIALKYKLSRSQKINAWLFSSSGALIRKEEYTATAGTGIYVINGFAHASPGIYLLKIECGNDIQTIKLVKK